MNILIKDFNLSIFLEHVPQIILFVNYILPFY